MAGWYTEAGPILKRVRGRVDEAGGGGLEVGHSGAHIEGLRGREKEG